MTATTLIKPSPEISPSSSPDLGTKHLDALWQGEINGQNERHLQAILVAGCIGTLVYIGYDYLTLPSLWLDLLGWRLFAVFCAITSLVLFLRKRLSALTAFAIFYLVTSFYLGRFASLFDDPIQLTAWNMNTGAAMFLIPLALMTFPHRFNVMLIVAFFANYSFWFLLNSVFSFYELIVYGGSFLVFVALTSLLGHWAKVLSAKRLAMLQLVIETKNQEILEKNSQLEFRATYDVLTGAFNRGAGLQILEDRIRLTHRDALDLTIVYVDVDNLKSTNDSLGHKLGDKLILGVVESIRNALRDVDLVCRLGGDEFLVVMGNCSQAEAQNIMNRICAKLEMLSTGSPFPYEISWGALGYKRADFHSVDEFIEGADRLMYEAKQEKKRLRRGATLDAKPVT